MTGYVSIYQVETNPPHKHLITQITNNIIGERKRIVIEVKMVLEYHQMTNIRNSRIKENLLCRFNFLRGVEARISRKGKAL